MILFDNKEKIDWKRVKEKNKKKIETQSPTKQTLKNKLKKKSILKKKIKTYSSQHAKHTINL